MSHPARSALIVGAGIGGLAAAWRLQRAGWQVTVFERAPHPAGRARTVRLGDCIVDVGATVMLGSYDATFALVREAGLDSELDVVSGKMAIPRDGQMHLVDLQHPVADFLRTRLLRPRTKLALFKLVPVLLKAAPHLNFAHLGGAAGMDTETLAQFCRRSLPAEAYDHLLNPMLKFLYLHNGEQGSLVELLWWLKGTGLKPTRALAGGTASLTDALAAQLDVRCNAEVLAARAQGDGAVVEVRTADGIATHTAARCLVTTPAPVTARIAPSTLTERQVRFLASRRYERSTVVTFCTRRRPALDALMVQMPDAVNADLATLVFQHQIHRQRAPAGKGIVNAYFMHAWSERHLQADDAAVVRAAQTEVQRLVPEVAELDAHHVHRWQHTAALTETGACARIAEFVADVNPANPVQCVGDYLAQASLNVAVSTAQAAVQRWIGQLAQ